jgi:antitoxin component of MazEF toxin-antitoxin module
MPIIRKIVTVGSSRGVTLPKSWLDNVERSCGPITTVAMEINGKIVLEPILRKKRRD